MFVRIRHLLIPTIVQILTLIPVQTRQLTKRPPLGIAMICHWDQDFRTSFFDSADFRAPRLPVLEACCGHVLRLPP